jgi:hypothetical protein
MYVANGLTVRLGKLTWCGRSGSIFSTRLRHLVSLGWMEADGAS